MCVCSQVCTAAASVVGRGAAGGDARGERPVARRQVRGQLEVPFEPGHRPGSTDRSSPDRHHRDLRDHRVHESRVEQDRRPDRAVAIHPQPARREVDVLRVGGSEQHVRLLGLSRRRSATTRWVSRTATGLVRRLPDAVRGRRPTTGAGSVVRRRPSTCVPSNVSYTWPRQSAACGARTRITIVSESCPRARRSTLSPNPG